MNRTALVTGASGFVGGRLSERLLNEGWTVHILLRESSREPSTSSLHVHRTDGTVDSLIAILREVAPDVVFHLASLYLTEHQPQQIADLVESNVLFPAQLVEAMSQTGVARLVNTGTAWQHFETADYNPVNLYAATKQACVDLLQYYHDARGLSVLTLELFDTYGPGDMRRKVIQLLVDAAQSGAALEMSPGDQVMDLLHVDDVVEGFLIAADRLFEEKDRPVFSSYLLSGSRHSLRALVRLVEQALGTSIDVEFGRRPYRAREVMAPIDPLGRVLPGWEPRRDLLETLREQFASEESAGR